MRIELSNREWPLFSLIPYYYSNRLLYNIRGWRCSHKFGLNHSCFFLGPSNRPYVKYNSFANYWPDARGAADEALWREKTHERKFRKNNFNPRILPDIANQSINQIVFLKQKSSDERDIHEKFLNFWKSEKVFQSQKWFN